MALLDRIRQHHLHQRRLQAQLGVMDPSSSSGQRPTILTEGLLFRLTIKTRRQLEADFGGSSNIRFIPLNQVKHLHSLIRITSSCFIATGNHYHVGWSKSLSINHLTDTYNVYIQYKCILSVCVCVYILCTRKMSDQITFSNCQKTCRPCI